MTRRRTVPAAPQPPQATTNGSPLVTLLLLAVVAWAGWTAYQNRQARPTPGPAPAPATDGPVLARAVYPTCAQLQSENYAKAAARLRAGDSIMAVNQELKTMNKNAMDAAFAPLETWMAKELTGATPEKTAAVYEALSKEITLAP